jgi:hypothetical protein
VCHHNVEEEKRSRQPEATGCYAGQVAWVCLHTHRFGDPSWVLLILNEGASFKKDLMKMWHYIVEEETRAQMFYR